MSENLEEVYTEKLDSIHSLIDGLAMVLKQLTAVIGVMQSTMTMNAFLNADVETQNEIARIMGKSKHHLTYSAASARNDLIRHWVETMNYKDEVFK